MKPGEISQPFRSVRGYQVFKLESKTEAVPRPFAEVRDDVYQRIMQGRVEGGVADAVSQQGAMVFDAHV